MSSTYQTEPDTHGEVLIKTTFGDIKLGLWSREAPKACRNFIQQSLEGYYTGCEFFRIIKGFMIQTGDPENSGRTCEHVYQKEDQQDPNRDPETNALLFPTEPHGRLQYRNRGMVGVANRGKSHPDSNGSQFFITLGDARHLNNVSTIFARILPGESMYSIIKMVEDVETDRKTDRPIPQDLDQGDKTQAGDDGIPRILSIDVINNPFDDIDIRGDKLQMNMMRNQKILKQLGLQQGGGNGPSGNNKKKNDKDQQNVESRAPIQAVKKKALLSMDDDEEEDEDGQDDENKNIDSKMKKGTNTVTAKSAHDLLSNDKRLVKDTAYDERELEQRKKELLVSETNLQSKSRQQSQQIQQKKVNKRKRVQDKDPDKDSSSSSDSGSESGADDSDNSDSSINDNDLKNFNKKGARPGLDTTASDKIAALKKSIMKENKKHNDHLKAINSTGMDKKSKKEKKKKITEVFQEGFTKGVKRKKIFTSASSALQKEQDDINLGMANSVANNSSNKFNPNPYNTNIKKGTSDLSDYLLQFGSKLKKQKSEAARKASEKNAGKNQIQIQNQNRNKENDEDDEDDDKNSFSFTGGLKFQVTGDSAFAFAREKKEGEAQGKK